MIKETLGSLNGKTLAIGFIIFAIIVIGAVLIIRGNSHKSLPDNGPVAPEARDLSGNVIFDPTKVPYGGNTLNDKPLIRQLDKPAFNPFDYDELTISDTGTLENPTAEGQSLFDPKEVKFFPLWDYVGKGLSVKLFYSMAPDCNVDQTAVTNALAEAGYNVPFEIEIYDSRNDPTGTLMYHPKDGSKLNSKVGTYWGEGSAWWDFQAHPEGPKVYDHPIAGWIMLMCDNGSNATETVKNANKDLIQGMGQLVETFTGTPAQSFIDKHQNDQLVITNYK